VSVEGQKQKEDHDLRQPRRASATLDIGPPTSYNSDEQQLPALRPPPRKRLGLAARKQAAKRKDSLGSSQPPVSNGIRKMEQLPTLTNSGGGTTARIRPALHRSASFLTLEEEEDKVSGRMLTEEPTGPSASWDSESESGIGESFFDFGRGVNSFELSDGLSD